MATCPRCSSLGGSSERKDEIARLFNGNYTSNKSYYRGYTSLHAQEGGLKNGSLSRERSARGDPGMGERPRRLDSLGGVGRKKGCRGETSSSRKTLLTGATGQVGESGCEYEHHSNVEPPEERSGAPGTWEGVRGVRGPVLV